MKIILLKIAIFILNILYTVFKIFPRDNRIVFISRQSNTPSMDFVLLEKQLHEDLPHIKTVMLTRRLENGAQASFANKLGYCLHMLKQLYHLARAKAVVLDSYCIAVSLLHHKKGLYVLQIWHAVGSMKKFGYAMIGKEEGSSAQIAELMRMHKNYNMTAISSLSFAKDYIEGFGITREQIVEIPLPRVDLLTDSVFAEKTRAELLAKYPVLAERKNILYCPTFRKDDESVTSAVNRLIDAVDLAKYNLIINMHPLCPDYDFHPGALRFAESTFRLLFAADYVISDYSSIIYEAGLLKKPIYAYAYDWEDYREKREINFDIAHDFPGIFTPDPAKIAAAIEIGAYDDAALAAFVKKNVTIPADKTCAQALSSLLQEQIS